MRKQKNKIADAILTADWHLRPTAPKCRTDNYVMAQWRKEQYIAALQRQHNCPVLVAGDLFDKAEGNPEWLIHEAIDNLPKEMICIPGQHDLPEHTSSNFGRSALALLSRHCTVKFVDCPATIFNNGKTRFSIYGFHWGAKLRKPLLVGKDKTRRVALIHTLTSSPGESIPGAQPPHTIFDNLKGYDLIVCGDNHLPFVYQQPRMKGGGPLFVSPGSLMRMDANQINHRPRVYLWYAETNEVEPYYLPIEKDVINREYIDKKKERDGRIESYREKLKSGTKMGISFEKNMEKYLQENKTKKSVRRLIHKCFTAEAKMPNL